MAVETLVVDEGGRIKLPARFANSTVRVEDGPDGALVIKLIEELGDDEPFPEDMGGGRIAGEYPLKISDRDRDAILAEMENPTPPGEALRQLFARPRLRNG